MPLSRHRGQMDETEVCSAKPETRVFLDLNIQICHKKCLLPKYYIYSMYQVNLCHIYSCETYLFHLFVFLFVLAYLVQRTFIPENETPSWLQIINTNLFQMTNKTICRPSLSISLLNENISFHLF